MTEEVQAEQAKELTVEVDGVQYPISTLSVQVQEMIQMHQSWNGDLTEASNKVNQIRAAVAQIANQVVEAVRADAAAKAAEAETPAEPAAE